MVNDSILQKPFRVPNALVKTWGTFLASGTSSACFRVISMPLKIKQSWWWILPACLGDFFRRLVCIWESVRSGFPSRMSSRWFPHFIIHFMMRCSSSWESFSSPRSDVRGNDWSSCSPFYFLKFIRKFQIILIVSYQHQKFSGRDHELPWLERARYMCETRSNCRETCSCTRCMTHKWNICGFLIMAHKSNYEKETLIKRESS